MSGAIMPREKSLQRRAAETRLARALEAASVESILDAAGRENVPDFVNRRRLRRAIDDALRSYRRKCVWDNKTAAKQRRAALNATHKAAQEMLTQLAGPEGDWLRSRLSTRMGPALSGQAFSFAEFESHLASIIRAAEADQGGQSEGLIRFAHSPFVLLVGRLSAIYERWLRQRPGYVKDSIRGDGDAVGPFIAFVQRILFEAGITTADGYQYSANTISGALTEFTTGKGRRRS